MLGKILMIVPMAAVLATGPVAEAQSASEMLEKGIYTEQTLGDLDSAIEIYGKIVAEAKDAQKYAAEAQFRLAECLLKQGKKDEATEAFEKLIKEFPDQKELLAKARQRVPGKAELELVPVPWADGEMLQLDMKMGGGLPIGTIVLTANKAKLDDRDVWHLQWRRFVTAGGNNQGISRVDADLETFRPINASFHHTLLGNFDAVYTPEEVTIDSVINGKNSQRKEKLDGVVYDNEQGMHLFRRLPLKEGYKATLPIYTTFGSGKIDLKSAVTAKETLEVPAGKFECYKLELTQLHQTFWISTDENRYVVKFEAGGVYAELTDIGQSKPGEPIEYHSEAYGITLSAPSGWNFYAGPVPGETDQKTVFLLDPEVAASSLVRLYKTSELDDEKKESPRAWAEEDLPNLEKRFSQFEVRPDGWKERTIGGSPAISMTADYVEGETKMVAYVTYVLGESTSAGFLVMVDQDRFDEFAKQFETILEGYMVKSL
ncbi:MAG TPA: tetratricopeptide repeat protein [Thermoguttaceae bacterium]|nr:tetratricopeptide repeat protein [Thermoguttaceae bacterium]